MLSKEERAYMVKEHLSAHPSHLVEVLVGLGLMVALVIFAFVLAVYA